MRNHPAEETSLAEVDPIFQMWRGGVRRGTAPSTDRGNPSPVLRKWGEQHSSFSELHPNLDLLPQLRDLQQVIALSVSQNCDEVSLGGTDYQRHCGHGYHIPFLGDTQCLSRI